MDEKGIGKIPDEILVKIFSFLEFQWVGRIARVCKRWKLVSGDDDLWKEISLTVYPKEMISRKPNKLSWKNYFALEYSTLTKSKENISIFFDQREWNSAKSLLFSGQFLLHTSKPLTIEEYNIQVEVYEIVFELDTDGSRSHQRPLIYYLKQTVRNQIQSLANKTLPPGNHIFPFKVETEPISSMIPPTFKTPGGHVRADVSVIIPPVSKSSNTIKKVFPIEILPIRDLEVPITQQTKAITDENLFGSSLVKLKATVPTAVTLGDTLSIAANVVNYSSGNVAGIRVTLVQRNIRDPCRYPAYENTSQSQLYRVIDLGVQPNSSTETVFEIKIPENILCSVESATHTKIRHLLLLKLSYETSLTSMLTFPKTMEFPIILLPKSR